MSLSRNAILRLRTEILSLEPWERVTLPQQLVLELLESYLENDCKRREKGGRSSSGQRRTIQPSKRP